MKSMIAAVAALAGVAAVANAALVVSQDFDGLPTANQTGYFPTPFGTHTAITAINSGAQTWYGSKIAGSNTTAMSLFADAGAGNGGGLYSYGQTLAATDRALGALASGTSIPAFGVAILNTTSETLDSFTLDFDTEMFRSSTSIQNILVFSYGTTAMGITAADFLTSGSMVVNTAGDVVGQAPVATNGAAYAFLGTNSVVVSGVSVAPGESFFFRWVDTNDAGNDAGLAINNLSFTAVPTPGSIALLGLAGVVAGRRRR